MTAESCDWGELIGSVAIGLVLGAVLGRWWAFGMVRLYLRSKRPDKHGFRTGIALGDDVYYVVTSQEYFEKIRYD